MMSDVAVIELFDKFCECSNLARKLGVNIDADVDSAARKVFAAADRDYTRELQAIRAAWLADPLPVQ
jgi:hypothetical protein